MCVFQGVGIKVMNDANKRHFDEKTLKIQVLNDRFRRTFTGGQVLMTSGVSSLPKPKLITLMNLVRTFDEFNGDNDPYGGSTTSGKSIFRESLTFGKSIITTLTLNLLHLTRLTKPLQTAF